MLRYFGLYFFIRLSVLRLSLALCFSSFSLLVMADNESSANVSDIAGHSDVLSEDSPAEEVTPSLRWKRAIDRDNGEELWQLLSQIDVKRTNDKGKTALMSAAKIGDQALLEKLVELGLGIEDKSHTGGTALMYAVLGNQAVMISYLLERTEHLDSQSTNGWTAAMIAAAKGFDGAIALLVDAGADANLQDVYQWSPLMRAIDNRHRAVITYLLSLPEPAVNDINENGSTALHVAAQFGDIATVKQLLERGALRDIVDKNNATAEQLALTSGYPEIAALISQSN